MRALRRELRTNRQLYNRLLASLATDHESDLSANERRLLRALVRIYGGSHAHYFNFYGPPGIVPTIRGSEVLDPDDSGDVGDGRDLSGKVVFVGAL